MREMGKELKKGRRDTVFLNYHIHCDLRPPFDSRDKVEPGCKVER